LEISLKLIPELANIKAERKIERRYSKPSF
jgi:hypothetical protein